MDTIGIDVSHWNGVMNWEITALAGAKFAIIRAGSINYETGIPYTDYKFEVNAENAPKHIDHIGYYWFWRANQDPRVQAKYFSNLIEYKVWDIPPVVDVEASNGIGIAKLTSNLKIFLDEVEDRIDTKPMIYTRASFWNYATERPDWGLNYKLWCARYVSITPILPSPMMNGPWGDGSFRPFPWANHGKDNWDYWQYWAGGNKQGAKYGAESTDIDMNFRRLPFEEVETIKINYEIATLMYEELKRTLEN